MTDILCFLGIIFVIILIVFLDWFSGPYPLGYYGGGGEYGRKPGERKAPYERFKRDS